MTGRNGGADSGANGGADSGANGGADSGANGGADSGANGGANAADRPEAAAVTREPFRFALPGADIRGDAWIPPDPVPGPAIIVCHGFKGFKDWGFFPFVARELAARTACLTVSFNFDGAGVRESTLTDLEAVMDGLATGRLGTTAVPVASTFGLLGHSRGGATCVLKSAVRSQVRALVTWSAIASVIRYTEMFAEQWDSGEPVRIPNARTGQEMPLYRNVLDDVRANRDRLDVLAAAARLEIPYLIVHGTEDESVPLDDANSLAATAADSHLEVIEGTGHTFGAGHPFAGPNPDLEHAIAATATHFTRVFDRS
jgi:pimeloyl-ACP methyl ester carboxylesterase